MAEEEAIFDASLKKKTKKKKKTPFDFDAAFADAAAGSEPAEPEAGKENENPDDEELKEMDDLDLESFGKKKKKTKKKPFVMEDVEAALPEAEAPEGEAAEDQEDLDLDFSITTKKKKKKKIAGPVEEDKEEKDDENAVAWATEGDYTYDELLNRVFNIMREKNPEMVAGEKKKFTMRPPQVVRIGTKKTSFANFSEICKMLHRQPKHVLAFLLAELGTSGSVDGNNQLIIKGRFQQKQMENVLRRYVKEYNLDNVDEDEIDNHLYGEDHDANDSSAITYQFEVCDSLLNVGPCGQMAVGEPASLSSEFEKRSLDPDVEIVTTSGYGKNGALCVLQRSVKPQVVTTSELPGVNEMFTVFASHGNEENLMHSYLLLSRSDSTMILQTGQEINEVDQSEFIVMAPTILAANLGNNKLIVQVCPNAIRLLDAAASSVQEIELEADFCIASASCIDPYVAVLSTLGRVGLLKLVDGSRLELTYPIPTMASFSFKNFLTNPL
uniref:EOG090X0AVX n=1 Tax=Moina brachiata TaxID=675436 RepID=A0A4Y7NKQ5_9CRUS|nr:EOG090X0AVX [Moina brachiata]SVE93186.1 EOG090X0AVX [Moina brachiata]